MRVLVACEYSGITRDAFAAKGHDAWSCDLLPTEQPGQHIQGDVLEILNDGWDLMIAHPPCTYLSYAGVQSWNNPGREEQRQAAMRFFMKFINAPIQRICVENPVGLPNVEYRKPDQIVHPYYFGEQHLKRTCLWLKNLPKLWYWLQDDLFGKRTATEYPEPIYIDKTARQKKRYFTDANHGGHARSKSFRSVANAMVEQWGGLPNSRLQRDFGVRRAKIADSYKPRSP